jgi:general nucleoside transport system permease protein
MNPLGRLRPRMSPVLSLAVFAGLTALLFWPSGLSPYRMLVLLWSGAFGSDYALSETLVKATPILWCALAVAVPAQVGLTSLGAEGQMYMGAIAGGGFVLALAKQPSWVLIPGMLLGAAVAGGLWGLIAGWLKARLNISEIIVSMLLNFIAIDFLDYLIHGPWRAVHSGNWPETARFPEASILPPILSAYRFHVGLIGALLAALALYFVFRWTRWGLIARVLACNPRLSTQAGVSYPVWIVLLMALGGAIAGIGGMAEASAVQGRLETHFLPGYGLNGFLASWLARHDFRLIIPVSVVMAAILSLADSLQLSAQLPASSALILQGFFFISVLAFSSPAPAGT